MNRRSPASALATIVFAASVTLASCSTSTPGSTSSLGTPAAGRQTPLPSSACRLPVSVYLGNQYQVGFVDFPGGTLKVDSDAIVYAGQGGGTQTLKQPVLKGGASAAYDAAAGRWLPTLPALVSVDGSRYAYTGPNNDQIHLVDVSTGADRVLLSGGQRLVSAMSLQPEGLLVREAGFPGDVGHLVVIDPATAVSRPLAAGYIGWHFAANGAVFGTDNNPDDPSPLFHFDEPGGVSPDRAWRLPISGGHPTLWLYRPGRLVEVAGLDNAGRLIVVVVGMDRTEVWALTGPANGSLIYQGPGHQGTDPLGLNAFEVGIGIADTHGFWLGTETGVARYSDGTGFQLVYSGQAPVTGAGPSAWGPAGSCR